MTIVFALLIVIGGLILLSVNFGLLSWPIISSLGLLVPLVIIILGLIILSRATKYARLATLIGFLIIIALILFALLFPPKTETVVISRPVESRFQEVEANIEFNSGRLDITATDELYEASMKSNPRGEPRVNLSSKLVTEETNRGSRSFERAVVTFKEDQTGPTLLGGISGRHHWDLALSNKLPIDLKLSGSLFRSDFDWSELPIRSFDVEMGGTILKVRLGSKYPKVTGEITAAVSNLTLEIPQNAGARFKTSVVGSSNMERAGYKRVGEDTFETPNYEDAPVKFDIQVDAGASMFVVAQY